MLIGKILTFAVLLGLSSALWMPNLAQGADLVALNSIVSELIQHGDNTTVRNRAYNKLEIYIGQYGAPTGLPSEVFSILERDLGHNLKFERRQAAKLLILLGSKDPNIAVRIGETYLLSDIFSTQSLEAVSEEELWEETPKISELISPFLKMSVIEKYLEFLKFWAEAQAKFEYEASTDSKISPFDIKAYGPVQELYDRATHFIRSKGDEVREPLRLRLLSDSQRNPQDFLNLERALFVCAYLQVDDPEFVDRYFAILKMKMPAFKLIKRNETQKALDRVKIAAALNITGVSPQNPQDVQKIIDLPLAETRPNKTDMLFSSAMRGSELATNALAKELLEFTSATPSGRGHETIDRLVKILAQLQWSEEAKTTIMRALSYSEVRSELRHRVETAVPALGQIIDPQVVESYLQTYADNDIVINHLLAQRLDHLTIDQRTILGTILKTVILKRLSPSASDMESLKLAKLAIDAAEQFDLLRDHEIQEAIVKIALLPEPTWETNMRMRIALWDEGRDLRFEAFTALEEIEPKYFSEQALLTLCNFKKGDKTQILKVLEKSETSSPRIQNILLALLKRQRPSRQFYDNRDIVLNTFDHLTIVDQNVKSELRELILKDHYLREHTSIQNHNLLISLGLKAPAEAMNTAEQIGHHLIEYPDDFIFLNSVITQANQYGIPKTDDQTSPSYERGQLDVIGLRMALIPTLNKYLQVAEPKNLFQFENLRKAIQFVGRLGIKNPETSDLLAHWAKNNAVGFVLRNFKMRDASTRLRYEALEVLGKAATDTKAVHQVLIQSLTDSDDDIRYQAHMTLETLEKNSQNISKSLVQDQNLRIKLLKTLEGRLCPTLMNNIRLAKGKAPSS